MGTDAQKVFIGLLLVVLVAAGYLYVTKRDVDESPDAVSAPPVAEPTDEPSTGPRYPLPKPPDEQAGDRKLVPLPPLDDSDGYFKLALEDLFGEGVGEILVDSALIEKVVATIDNLPRDRLAERIRPVTAAPGAFSAMEGESDEVFVLGPDNYRRYDSLVGRFAAMDLTLAADVYRRFYPLLQEAYVGLGYPDGYFNDRVVEVIDHLIATPEPKGPVLLVRPHVFFQFADPNLETLSSGQKLMLRIGPDNARSVKHVLDEFRSLIVASD